MAPEVFLTKNCGASPALDIWALGCILYTMVVGKLPFKADKVAEVKQRILHDPVIFPKDIELSDEVKDLTARMLDKDPETRASVFEINESAWKNKRKFTEEEKERIKEREAAVRAKLLEEQMKLNREREEENVKNARESLNVSTERFRLGQTNALEVQTAQNTLEQALTRRNLVQYNLKATELQLRFLAGEL